MVAVITAFSMFGLLQICRGDQHIISGQLIGYGLASHAINNHLVNPANNLCGFFINQKMVFVLWVTPVPIGDCAAAPLAILHPGTENGSYFVAGVLCIPLIEQRLFGKGKDKQAEIQYSCGFAAGWLPKS